MNKQELKEQIQGLSIAQNGLSYDKGNVSGVGPSHKIGTLKVLRLINQFDEPEKVVVPKFVAEWIEECRQENMAFSYALCNYQSFHNTDIQGWFNRLESEETFARAWLDGYEVEQEKLYTVEIPNPNEDEFLTVLAKAFDGKVFIDRTANVNWRYHKQFQLTESEIRKDFDWAWQWAEEVKEVE